MDSLETNYLNYVLFVLVLSGVILNYFLTSMGRSQRRRANSRKARMFCLGTPLNTPHEGVATDFHEIISYNRPSNTLERKGLVEATHEFIAQVNTDHVLDIYFMVLKDCRVPKEKEIHIFRIIQEILQNTIKHSEAKKLQIGISEQDGNFLLLTKDDGKGFDIQNEKSHLNGLGIKNLESRSELLNGSLTLESNPGSGTNYFLKIPLN